MLSSVQLAEQTGSPYQCDMKRALLVGLFLVLSVFAAATWWMFYENSPPDETSFALDIEALREAAASIEGEGPTSIEVETIYLGELPRISMVTGTDWSDFTMA